MNYFEFLPNDILSIIISKLNPYNPNKYMVPNDEIISLNSVVNIDVSILKN
jgi:excinuclease UvrABC helicase subunit UvrB